MEPNKIVKCVTGHTAKLYNADCMDVGAIVGSIDAVITDPPYIIKHLGGGGCFQESNQKMFNPDASGISDIIDGYDIAAAMDQWIAAGAKNVVCFCSNDQVAETFNEMARVGLSPTIMVWHKYNACPMVNNTWIPDVEYMVVGRKLGKGGYINNDVPTSFKSRVRRYPMCSERSWHPTAKPLTLLAELIEVLCPPDGLVFEPFGGSGSTAIQCLKSKRNVVVVEKNPDYYSRMEREISMEATQNRMF